MTFCSCFSLNYNKITLSSFDHLMHRFDLNGQILNVENNGHQKTEFNTKKVLKQGKSTVQKTCFLHLCIPKKTGGVKMSVEKIKGCI